MTAPPPATRATADHVFSNMVRGRVVRAGGQPVAGAKLFLCGEKGKVPAPQATADANGRFRFALDAPAAGESSIRFLLAAADGRGLDWIDVRSVEPGRDVTLRLPDDLPVRGKVVDLEGKTVGGAAVQVVELTTSESGNLDEFLKRWAEDKEKVVTGPTFRLLTDRQLWSPPALNQLAGATTGSDGTFRLTGIGRDRGLMLRVRGPGIADYYSRVVTRPDYQPTPGGPGAVALSGPEPTVSVSPSKPITGTVRDAQRNTLSPASASFATRPTGQFTGGGSRSRQ